MDERCQAKVDDGGDGDAERELFGMWMVKSEVEERDEGNFFLFPPLSHCCVRGLSSSTLLLFFLVFLFSQNSDAASSPLSSLLLPTWTTRSSNHLTLSGSLSLSFSWQLASPPPPLFYWNRAGPRFPRKAGLEHDSALGTTHPLELGTWTTEGKGRIQIGKSRERVE